jgi:predicted Zn-ribbon and HTH transcriptional regulator
MMPRTDQRVVLNFECQWCGMPFRRLSAEIIPCPFCKSEHVAEQGHPGPSDWDDDDDDDQNAY